MGEVKDHHAHIMLNYSFPATFMAIKNSYSALLHSVAWKTQQISGVQNYLCRSGLPVSRNVEDPNPRN